MSRSAVSKSGASITDRALAAGWQPGNGMVGPREFLKLKPEERACLRRSFKTRRGA